MAIAAVGGANNTATTAVTTLTTSYVPTAGNIVVLFMSFGGGISALVVKDNLGNTLTAGPVVGTTMGSFYYTAPSGVTGFTATWTTAQQGSMVLEEYSGSSGVGNTNTAGSTSATSSVSVTIQEPNNFVVAVCGSGNTMTASVGTQRQQTTTSTGRATLLDNTSATAGSVTCSCTQTSIGWGAIGLELGGPGKPRVNQDVQLVIHKGLPKARVNQDVQLVIRRGNPRVRVNQDVLLVIHKRAAPSRIQPFVFVNGD